MEYRKYLDSNRILSELGWVSVRAAGDGRTLMQAFADLCVAHLADWSSVCVHGGGLPCPPAVAHAHPAEAELVRALLEPWPPPDGSPSHVLAVLHTGRTEHVANASEAQLAAWGQGSRHLALRCRLDPRSWILAPLQVADQHPFGALVIARGPGRAGFDEEDAALAEEIARRSAVALDHARLFAELVRRRGRSTEPSPPPPAEPLVAPGSGELRPSPTARENLAGMRVLVVDDEPEVRELVVQLLSSLSADVRAADSVAAALRELDVFSPDVVLSDIGMPGESGYTLAQRLRAAAGGGDAGLPVVALTAFADAEDRRQALLAGFDAHLAKPVDAGELVAVLAAYHGTGKARRTCL